MTVYPRDILSLHLFLNKEALLLGEEPHFMTSMRETSLKLFTVNRIFMKLLNVNSFYFVSGTVMCNRVASVRAFFLKPYKPEAAEYLIKITL